MEINYQNQPFNYYMPEFERNDSNGYQGMMQPKFANVFLDECSYTIEKKKMNSIAENVDRYFSEIPDELKYAITFGKSLQLIIIDEETEKLRDSTLAVGSRDRRPPPQKYNYSVLNELSSKIKS